MINELQKRLELFNKAKENIKSDLKKFVVDKSYPLNERWNLFIESDLGDNDVFMSSFESFDINSYYYRNFNRYELISVKKMLETLKLEEEEENNFKEEILQMFIKSFIFDW